MPKAAARVTSTAIELPILLSFRELEALEAMMRAGGHGSYRAVVAHALRNYCDHLDCGADGTVFVEALRVRRA